LFGSDTRLPEPRDSLRLIQLDRRLVRFRFTRSRRRTISISIDADGLAIAAPRHAPWVEIEKFLREKTRWILRKLDDWGRAGSPVRIFGEPGESLPVSGRILTLEVAEGVRRVELVDDRLLLQLRRAHERARVKAELLRWLKAHALTTLAPRVAHYAALLDRPVPQVTVSNARTQWGVCTQDGRIRLSWRLVHVPPALADYVVAHEVAHLVELNHSPRFWKLVETLYPECRTARRSLDLAAAALPII
jgi:predicted metal-dependent hydrolase